MAFTRFSAMALIVLAILVADHAMGRQMHPPSMAERHEHWMLKHDRVYNNATEKERRFKIFSANAEYIDSFNAQNHGYRLGINQFSDLTREELNEIVGCALPDIVSGTKKMTANGFMYENVTNVPDEINWVKEGAVTPVKQQGSCGCCWAFSAIAALEGINKLTNWEGEPLSVQQLVDCSRANNGCTNGRVSDAFEYMQNNGVVMESEYPFVGVQGICSHSGGGGPPEDAMVSEFERVPSNDEGALLKAVANQPVSVDVDGSSYDFKHYTGGIFRGSCTIQLTHALTVVGYGTDANNTKYWLLKNSWGVQWGENGYMRMLRDVEAKEGMCGIAMFPLYPLVYKY